MRLGQIDAALAPALADALRESLRDAPPLRVTVAGPVAYPDPTRARLLIAFVSDSVGVLGDMAERIEKLRARVGLPPTAQRIVPHVVFARAPLAMDLSQWMGSMGRVEQYEAVVTECVLYDGSLPSVGAEYPALARIGLAFPGASRSQRPRAARKSVAPGGGPAASANRVAAKTPAPNPRAPINADSHNTVSTKTVSDNTVSTNTVLTNTVSDNTVSTNTASTNTVSTNTVSTNTVSTNTASTNTVSDNVAPSKAGPSRPLLPLVLDEWLSEPLVSEDDWVRAPTDS